MANNELNKDWKQELEQIELRSGDLSFEKMAAWNKLYQRLEPTNSKRGAGWFKWAAVLIAFGSLVLFYSIKQSAKNSVSVTLTSPTNNKTNNLPTNKTVSTEKGRGEEMVSKENETRTNKKTFTSRSKDVKASRIIVAALEDNPSVTVTLANTLLLAAPIVDTSRYITKVGAPEKRKLRVIHINDYAVPVKPDIFMAENLKPGTRYLLRLNSFHSNNEINNEPATSPTIKINLSPQN